MQRLSSMLPMLTSRTELVGIDSSILQLVGMHVNYPNPDELLCNVAGLVGMRANWQISDPCMWVLCAAHSAAQDLHR